jgi:hypothetical protein
MADDVLGKFCLPKAFAPRLERDIAIQDGPAERLGEDPRIMVQIGGFRPSSARTRNPEQCVLLDSGSAPEDGASRNDVEIRVGIQRAGNPACRITKRWIGGTRTINIGTIRT